MYRALRNLARLLGIARTLARHDALFPIERTGAAPFLVRVAKTLWKREAPGRPGERLAKALETLGPSFIKLGQMLSTRPDLLGEDVANDLAGLRDRLPPFPSAAARATVEAELGGPLDRFFLRFDDTPVAAASIAQVHFAATSDGQDVAVKVLRPGIEDAFARDLDLFYWCASMLERLLPEFRRLKPYEVVRTFAESVALEMDLRMEAAAAVELGENFEGDATFRVPRIDWERTARRVLTLERVRGINIDRRDQLSAAGHDPDTILAHAAAAFFNQVFRDGFFHADQHPGNCFVEADGTICALDFGIMGRLDRETRYYLADMLMGFLRRDYETVADVHFRAGFVPAHKSRAAFTQALRAIAEPIMDKPMHEISVARLLGLLFEITETFEMETQPQLLLLQKTMLVTEGVGRALNPHVNMWAMARPLIEGWMRRNRGPEARLRMAVRHGLETLERLPAFMERVDRAINSVDGVSGARPPARYDTARRYDRGHRPAQWPLWTAIGALAFGLLLVALF
ncbi:MAG: 2-polyprenylphenol 6-hydroxylase [Rhodospirillaceae bacterium]|nr:2-polyprenylphenol 6-hydroxylase [Rhodospirillaceae bacterium]